MSDNEIRQYLRDIYKQIRCKQFCIGLNPSGGCDSSAFLNQCGNWVDLGTFGIGNIYNLNGTLTGNRVLTQNGNDLTFSQGNLGFISFPSSNLIGLSYLDASYNAINDVEFFGGHPFAQQSVYDLITGNEATITSNYNQVELRFLDFGVDPTFANRVSVDATGFEVEGNTQTHISNTYWHGWTGIADLQIARFYNDGGIQFYQYPNTRNDTGTFTPTSFLYPDGSGNILNAPLSALNSWFLTGNSGTNPAIDYIGTNDATVLNIRANASTNLGTAIIMDDSLVGGYISLTSGTSSVVISSSSGVSFSSGGAGCNLTGNVVTLNATSGLYLFTPSPPAFDNDVAAGLGGLSTGYVWQTTGADITVAGGTIGVLMIKQ